MNNGIEGDVQSRMDAFRGNPQALAQRYSQDQQLIDLLALQKLKSEKDAAARQMQMQAGQGEMPTIAQQREQELMGMAKQDVAQRVGAVGQQQAQQQQKNLQQAMQGGIAQAPAPNMMPPQAMASGGIVAFAEGGTPAGRLLSDVTGAIGKTATGLAERQQTATSEAEEKKRLRQAIDKALGMAPGISGAFVPQSSEAWKKANALSSASAARLATVDDLRKILAEATQLRSGPQAAPAQVPPQAQGIAQAVPAQAALAQAAPTQAVPPAQTAPTQAVPPTGEFQGDPQQISAELATISDPAERAAATAAFQRQMAAGNLAPQGQGAPQGQDTSAPTTRPAQPGTSLQGGLESYLSGALKGQPEAGPEAEAGYAKRVDPLYQQQRELSQQGIASAQQLAERERALRDPLTAFLLGGRGRTIGEVLGSAGRAGVAYQGETLSRDKALADQLQKLREAELGAQVTQEKEKYGVGTEAAKAARDAAKTAAAVAGPYLSKEAQVAAATENAQLRAQAAINKAVQDKSLTEAQTAAIKIKAGQAVDARIKNEMQLRLDVQKNPNLREQLIAVEVLRALPSGAGSDAPAPTAAAPSADRPPLTSFKR